MTQDTIYTVRNRSLDITAGFFLCYMIVYHVCQWFSLCDTFLFQILTYLNFFMPWFYFKGGMNFRNQDTHTLVHKSAKRLLIPFVQWSMVGLLIGGIIDVGLNGHFTLIEYLKYNAHILIYDWSVAGNMPLWYLISLFIVRIIVNVSEKCRISIMATACAGLIIAIAAHFVIAETQYHWTNVFSGIFFFCCGIMMKNFQEHKWVVCAGIMGYILCSVISRPYVDMKTNILSEGYYLLWPIWSLVGIITINAISRIVTGYARCLPLEFVGQYSMYFYVIHWPVIVFANYLLR